MSRFRQWMFAAAAILMFAPTARAQDAAAPSASSLQPVPEAPPGYPQVSPPPADVTLPLAAPPAAQAPLQAQQLLLERQQVLARRVSLVAPITLLSVGLGLVIVGWGVVYPDESSNHCLDDDGSATRCGRNRGALAGALIGLSGSVLSVVGAAMLSGRIVRRIRRGRELNRIDSQLRGLGIQASLAPWLGRGAGSPVGLLGTVSF